MLPPLMAALVAGLMLGLVGLGGYAASGLISLPVPARLPVGIVAIGAVALIGFVVVWLVPGAASGLGFIVLLASIAAIIVGRRMVPWRALLSWAVVVVGVTFVYFGMLYLWRSGQQAFALVDSRFTARGQILPIDNEISALFADALAAGRSTHGLTGDWNGSDRPPLLSGVILIVRPVLQLLGFGSRDAAFAIGVSAQLLWIPGTAALAGVLGAGRRGALVCVLAVGGLSTTLLNSLFTWPKMLSAALVLAALALLLVCRARRGGPIALWVAAGIGYSCALLAHGAALFAAPVVALVGVSALRSVRRDHGIPRPRWRRLLSAAVAAVGVYVPWTLYQRFADPPGDRLLKWHLAGVIPVDGRSFPRALIDQYASLTPAEWWHARVVDLGRIFAAPGPSIWPLDESTLSWRRHVEFFDTDQALGLYSIALVVVVIVAIARLVRRRGTASDLLVLTMTAGCLLCLAFWVLVMFLPGATIVHQGSQVWMILLVCASTLWIARRRPRWGVLLIVAAQAVVTAVYFAPSLTPASLSPTALVTTLAGVGLVVTAAVRLTRRPVRRVPTSAQDRVLSAR